MRTAPCRSSTSSWTGLQTQSRVQSYPPIFALPRSAAITSLACVPMATVCKRSCCSDLFGDDESRTARAHGVCRGAVGRECARTLVRLLGVLNASLRGVRRAFAERGVRRSRIQWRASAGCRISMRLYVPVNRAQMLSSRAVAESRRGIGRRRATESYAARWPRTVTGS